MTRPEPIAEDNRATQYRDMARRAQERIAKAEEGRRRAEAERDRALAQEDYLRQQLQLFQAADVRQQEIRERELTALVGEIRELSIVSEERLLRIRERIDAYAHHRDV